MTLLAGRFLDERDVASALPVAVVSEELVRQAWPGEDPLGKRVRRLRAGVAGPWMTVVGVVKDVKEDRFGARFNRPVWYVPYAQATFALPVSLPLNLVVRTSGEPTLVAAAVREAVGGRSSPAGRDDDRVQALVTSFYEAGKVTAVICHATCVLLKTRLSDGRLLVEGKTWTGFANSEERFVDEFVGLKVQPFWIEEEARKLENTNFIVNGRFKPHAVRDGNLITGQQQYSGRAAARLMIEALGT